MPGPWRVFSAARTASRSTASDSRPFLLPSATMSSNKDLSEIRPLAIGRLTRVLFRIGTLLVAALGVSFIVGGLLGNDAPKGVRSKRAWR